jgi:hypothetical protein
LAYFARYCADEQSRQSNCDGGLLAAFGAAAYFSVYQTGRQPASDTSSTSALSGLAGKLTGVVPVEELSGLIAVDVEPYFQDPRGAEGTGSQRLQAQRAANWFARYGGARDSGQTPDFFYSSGVVAANQIGDAAKKANIPTTVYSPLYTPMVIASWAPIAQILAANGMATEASPASGMWTWPS